MNLKVGNGASVEILDSHTPKESWVLHRKGHRNHLLAESDRFIVDDYPTSKLTEWKTYRQALRDFDFSSYEIGDEITWPIKPE